MSWLRKIITTWLKTYGTFTSGIFATFLGIFMLVVFVGSQSNPGDKGLILLSIAVGIIGVLALIQGLVIINKKSEG